MDVNRFGLIAGAIVTLTAAASTCFAQHASPVAKPKPVPARPAPATVTHPLVAGNHVLVAPPRNAIGLPAASPAAGTVGAMHGPGAGANINAAKPGAVSVGDVRSGAQHAPATPITAKGALSGSQMGRPVTGAAMLGGGATHAPSAVIGHNNASIKH
jgi:hypothetical protein